MAKVAGTAHHWQRSADSRDVRNTLGSHPRYVARLSISHRAVWFRDASDLLRAVILGIFLLGVAGLTIELVLLEHYDEYWQWTPFVMFGLSALVLLWYAVRRTAAAIRVFRAMTMLFLAAGAYGIFLHYDGNVEFERELSPEVLGWALFREAVFGATPTLAPGAMVQLGLLGLAFTIRHPALRASGGAECEREDS
ncbi:MAG TPA: hypothetical protein VK922_03420 [Gemmatimonadaceae bacterium]|nr:hypothetical protein [Gemmatimonadaceae bacterium]